MTVVIIDVYQQLWSELVSLTGDFWNVLIYLPFFNFLMLVVLFSVIFH